MPVPISKFMNQRCRAAAQGAADLVVFSSFPKNGDGKQPHWRERQPVRAKKNGDEWVDSVDRAAAADNVDNEVDHKKKCEGRERHPVTTAANATLLCCAKRYRHTHIAHHDTREYPCDMCSKRPALVIGLNMWRQSMYRCTLNIDRGKIVGPAGKGNEPASGTSGVSGQQPGLDKDIGECYYHVCRTCHTELNERCYQSIDAVVEG